MTSDHPEQPDRPDFKEAGPWRRKVTELVAQRRYAQALRLLDRVIEQQMPLFRGDKQILADRRLAWLYRIELLRFRGRLSEALAWTCLEYEMNPINVTARALKERLKSHLDLVPTDESPRSVRTRQRAALDVWSGVAGMRELKAVLERDVILPLQEPELYEKYRVSLPNGILLHGPPGCGKTFIARKLAQILGFRFLDVMPSDLGSIYVHGGQLKVAQLFEEARTNRPCLIFLDEIDALVPSRSGNLYHHYAAEVNELLTHLNDAAKQQILVVAATNRIEKIDPAALRPGRFDKKIYVGTPDLEARLELLKMCMKDRPQETIDWLALARESEGYTCAELEHCVNEAARRALDGQRRISFSDLMTALAANPPAHNEGSEKTGY